MPYLLEKRELFSSIDEEDKCSCHVCTFYEVKSRGGQTTVSRLLDDHALFIICQILFLYNNLELLILSKRTCVKVKISIAASS